jgi:hypothetical protein
LYLGGKSNFRAWTRGDMWNETRYVEEETYPYFFQWMRNRRYVREVIYDRVASLSNFSFFHEFSIIRFACEALHRISHSSRRQAVKKSKLAVTNR